MKKCLIILPIFFVFLFHCDRSSAAVQLPTLKWEYGACFNSWCETGWYSSPAVADLDGDGDFEVIGSAYSVVVLDGTTGSLIWRANSGHDVGEPSASNVGRTWPGIVVADVDNDSELEIVTAHDAGYVSVYDRDGNFEPGWPQRPATSELRGLVVFDIDSDGTMEIIVNVARGGGNPNTWVFEHNGTVRAGWPQLANASGYAAGVYHDNASVGDLDGDGQAEIIVPSDVHYICAYTSGGVQLPAHSMYGGKGWGAVGVWESPIPELRGYGDCDGTRVESHRTNMAHGASIISDVNADGIPEVIVTGNVYNCAVGHPPGVYNGIYIFNADRSRFNRYAGASIFAPLSIKRPTI